jgi:enoyl-CoA hydratase/carnithine racemase
VTNSERLIEEMAKEEDFREGVAALVEKRSPDWPSVK